jgi:hypothetical protein
MGFFAIGLELKGESCLEKTSEIRAKNPILWPYLLVWSLTGHKLFISTTLLHHIHGHSKTLAKKLNSYWHLLQKLHWLKTIRTSKLNNRPQCLKRPED